MLDSGTLGKELACDGYPKSSISVGSSQILENCETGLFEWFATPKLSRR